MKLRYLFVLICLFLVNINYVDASSIEYNLTIDNNGYFSEKNIYKIDKSDVDRTSYNHMTAVLDDDIYFDNDKSVKYKKNVKEVGGSYVVTLEHEYSGYFFSNSRIMNECFDGFDFKMDVDKMVLKTSSPFLCSHRADNIVINVVTDFDVTTNDADNVSLNKYTWIANSKDFDLKFGIKLENTYSGSDSGEGTDFVEEDEVTENGDFNSANTEKNKIEQNDDKSISFIGVGIVLLVIFVVGIIAFVILNSKKKSLNKI